MADERLRRLLDRIYQRAPPGRRTEVSQDTTSSDELPQPPPLPGPPPAGAPTPIKTTVVTIRFGDDPAALASRHGLPLVPWEQLEPHFGPRQPRPGQREALLLAVAALRRFHDVVIEAPTGIGKSAIAKAVSDLYRSQGARSFLVAHRNFLLEQYRADHPGLRVIKGMSNYDCVLDGHRGQSVATAPCQTRARFRCPVKDECPYFAARDDALAGPATLTNYDYLYWSGAVQETFPSRELLVLDEAHNLESALMSNFQFALSDAWIQGLTGRRGPTRVVSRLLFEPDSEARSRILIEVWRHVRRRFDDEARDPSSGRHSPERLPPESRRRYERALDQLFFLASELRLRPENWVLKPRNPSRGADGGDADGVDFKPVSVAPYATQLLSLGEKRLHLSATILDENVYLRALGIPKACVIKVADSPFPVESRPVVNLAVARLNRETLDENLPRLLAAIDDVLDRHPHEKGLILPYTNRIGEAIDRGGLRNAARLVTHGKDASARDAVLRRFLAEKTGNRVLVSTYANEGLDFLDEAARFCVIVKCPFPDLSDPQVKTRKERDPGWYENETLKVLVQMAGRIVRSATDRGTTYVLDQNADGLIRRHSHAVPAWFRQAYRTSAR